MLTLSTYSYFCFVMKRNEAYILLGSNMGDRIELISKANLAIELQCGTITKKSSLYESEPWGFDAETPFVNQAILLYTELEAHKLLSTLLQIEADLGRTRNPDKKGYSSRPIDIDILYYNNDIINTSDLIVPHPRLQLRKFALIPLTEIAPNHTHPILLKTNAELLNQCTDPLKVEKI